jgi:hypothetical protein
MRQRTDWSVMSLRTRAWMSRPMRVDSMSARPAARAALEALTDAGILRRADLPGSVGPGRPRRWWVAGELLDLLTR